MQKETGENRKKQQKVSVFSSSSSDQPRNTQTVAHNYSRVSSLQKTVSITTFPQASRTTYWHQSPMSVQFCLIKCPLLQTHLINFYLLSQRIFVINTGTGMKDASSAPNAITLWWKSLLLPRMTACCAQSVILMSAPLSASNAKGPSCLVRYPGSTGV